MKIDETKEARCYLRDCVAGRGLLFAALVLVHILLGAGGVVFALFLKKLVDAAVAQAATPLAEYAIALVLLILILAGLRAFLRYFEEYLRSLFENKIKADLFGRLLSGRYETVQGVHSAEWLNRLSSDTAIVADGIVTILPNLAGMCTRIIAVFVALCIIDGRCVYVVLIGGFIFVLCTYFFRKRMKLLHKRVQEKDGQVRSYLQEALLGLTVIKAYGRETEVADAGIPYMNHHRQARLERVRFSNLYNTGFALAMNGAYLFGAVYGAYGIYTGTIGYGTMIAVVQLIGQLQNPFANITGVVNRIAAVLASTERILEIKGDLSFETEKKCNLGRVRMNGVSFDYGDGRKVLEAFDFAFEKGDYVAITGTSGSGKSTIFKLLMGLYRVKGGSIELDDASGETTLGYDDYLTAARKLYGYVPQKGTFMKGSVRDILTFANKSNRENDAELLRVLEIVCALDFVRELPGGLDAEIGEGGSGISEGQLQRLAIARAILSGREILLLDEATSALDEATERRLLENLRQMTNITVLIVTHRPEALKICNKEVRL